MTTDQYVGLKCKLNMTLRDIGGITHKKDEELTIIKAQISLGKLLLLAQFANGTSSYVVPEEITLIT